MKLATYEQFLEANQGKKAWYEDKRHITKFPYTAIAEGHYPEIDFAFRWCWQRFGPADCKVCHDHESEYPACALVLATEPYVIKKSYTGTDGKVHEYDLHTRAPEEHGHEGTWTTVWLGKTGYDYGFTEYYFLNEVDRDLFVEAAPAMGLGENYED